MKSGVTTAKSMKRVAILGTGEMGETVLLHLRKNGIANEIVVHDNCPERVTQLKAKYAVPGTTRLNDILADDEISLVFVTSSNSAHTELAISSLKARKAVMCEKPIAPTLADAKKIVETAERVNGFLQIGFELRYSKLYMKIKEWIDAGLLGRVVNTHCYYICSEFHHKGSWRNRKATVGSMFNEKLCHYVDLPRWWVGTDVQVVDAFTACAPNVVPYYEVHDNYHTTYRFENGAVGHITFMMAVAETFDGDPLRNIVSQQNGDGHALQFMIQGTKGAAWTDCFGREIKRWEFADSPKCLASKLVENLTWNEEEDLRHVHNTEDQTLDIVKRVMDGKGPKIDPRDAYETMRLSEAAEISADTGRLVRLDETNSSM